MSNKSRCFALELYPEDETHMNILEYIIKYFSYVFILHDKDVFDKDVIDETTKEVLHKVGELKKPHYHVIITFNNARSLNKVLEELCCVGRIKHIETCNFYAYTRYLVHLDYPLKHQYDVSEIQTNIRTRVENALKREYNSKEQDSRILIDYIKSKNSYITFMQLVDYAVDNNCLLEVKKNSYFYKSLCDDIGFRRY